MRLLEDLQGALERTYALEAGHRVTDFLTTSPELSAAFGLSPGGAASQEHLLVAEHETGMDLAVYLDADVLARLGREDPLRTLHDGNLEDFWTVLEGVSHFLYLTWNAGRGKPVTLMELELQAEVDKFVLTALVAAGQHGQVPAELHHWLFRLCQVDPGLDAETRARYERASRYASAYCSSLARRFLREGASPALVPELRHFYRLTQRGKLSHIGRHAGSPGTP
jgi:hypothetical protein